MILSYVIALQMLPDCVTTERTIRKRRLDKEAIMMPFYIDISIDKKSKSVCQGVSRNEASAHKVDGAAKSLPPRLESLKTRAAPFWVILSQDEVDAFPAWRSVCQSPRLALNGVRTMWPLDDDH